MMGGFLVASYDTKKLLLASNALAIISNSIKLIETFPTLVLGRLLFGVFTGIQQLCLSKILNETVPVQAIQIYGQFINGGLGFGCFLANLFGFIIPIEDPNDTSSLVLLREDKNWRIVYSFSIVMEVLTLLLVPCLYETLTLKSVAKELA